MPCPKRWRWPWGRRPQKRGPGRPEVAALLSILHQKWHLYTISKSFTLWCQCYVARMNVGCWNFLPSPFNECRVVKQLAGSLADRQQTACLGCSASTASFRLRVILLPATSNKSLLKSSKYNVYCSYWWHTYSSLPIPCCELYIPNFIQQDNLSSHILLTGTCGSFMIRNRARAHNLRA